MAAERAIPIADSNTITINADGTYTPPGGVSINPGGVVKFEVSLPSRQEHLLHPHRSYHLWLGKKEDSSEHRRNRESRVALERGRKWDPAPRAGSRCVAIDLVAERQGPQVFHTGLFSAPSSLLQGYTFTGDAAPGSA